MTLGYKLNSSVEIFPGGAVLLRESNTMVVADLHLGCEAALEHEGLSIPRLQTRAIEQYLTDTVASVRPDRLVVAGDLKHNFSRNLVQEWQDVSRFVRNLKGLVSLVVVKGNHDNFLGSILRELGTSLVMETDSGGIRIAHGHTGVRSAVPTVMGHLHPSIVVRDGVGASVKDRCFLYSERDRMLILPALSLVASGLEVVGQLDSDRSSPLLPEDGLACFVPILFADDRPLKFPAIKDLRAMRGFS
jgi:putative SbcD/Mre11-related phosphoesterase